MAKKDRETQRLKKREKCRLTLSPLSTVGVQVIGVKSLWLAETIQNLPDVHDLHQEKKQLTV